ncbi:MAG: RluA family pseudouridine synthase [Candidatus Doudnabacteria bacterium]|nr:RluA family pseudouridine synthase [Candidatus Doudnabacteria bacterium]
MRLDKQLIELHPQLSRAQAKELIEVGNVLVNGSVVSKASTRLAEDDVVALQGDLPSETPHRAAADDSVELTVLFEDDDVLVLNKPAGLVVHPGEKQPMGTVANALVARYPSIAAVGEDPLRPGIVHRLDKQTSGVLIVAKTQQAYDHLKTQFKERRTTKRYTALAVGLFKRGTGVYDAPIGRSEGNFRKMAQGRRGVRHPREAVTRFEVAEQFPVERAQDGGYALLHLKPETGRMHQLRVHLAAAHHPIVGDAVYGWRDEDPFDVPRILLHAKSLRIELPSGDKHTFVAPLPQDFSDALDSVRSLT